jgi:hypothetical protein
MDEQQQITRSAGNFARATVDHTVTILNDNGLYRHLRVSKPDSSMYAYELITVPGILIYRSADSTFTFARLDDMFQFFRSEKGKVNPHYWAEKITDDRDRVRVYSGEVFRTVVLEQFHDRLVDGEIPLRYAGAALDRLARDVLDDDVIGDESIARAALRDYEYLVDANGKTDSFTDTWEWDAWEWDTWYLWACHAIVHGIKLYDTAKACPECKGERGTHNTTVTADTDGGTVRKCSRDPKAVASPAAVTEGVDPAVRAAGRASTCGKPYVAGA